MLLTPQGARAGASKELGCERDLSGTMSFVTLFVQTTKRAMLEVQRSQRESPIYSIKQREWFQKQQMNWRCKKQKAPDKMNLTSLKSRLRGTKVLGTLKPGVAHCVQLQRTVLTAMTLL